MEDNVTSFAVDSSSYAAHRPTYPKALFDWISTKSLQHELVWDCGTGNGQAARSLTRIFDRVYATDLSLNQIEAASRHDRIFFSDQPSEATDFDDQSFDAVTVAQALHWFDFDAYWREVRRVARPGALFCAWSYVWFEGHVPFDSNLIGPVREIIDPFWSDRNRLMWRGYQDEDIAFPFERLTIPDFHLSVAWTIAETIAHIKTWSAYKRAIEDEFLAGELEAIFDRAIEIMGIETVLPLRCPLVTLAGRIE